MRCLASELRPGDVVQSGECAGWTVIHMTVFPLPHGPDWALFCPTAHRILLTLECVSNGGIWEPTGEAVDETLHTRTAWLHANATVDIERE